MICILMFDVFATFGVDLKWQWQSLVVNPQLLFSPVSTYYRLSLHHNPFSFIPISEPIIYCNQLLVQWSHLSVQNYYSGLWPLPSDLYGIVQHLSFSFWHWTTSLSSVEVENYDCVHTLYPFILFPHFLGVDSYGYPCEITWTSHRP